MGKTKKKHEEINPEIRHEIEKERTKNFHENEYGEYRLFPGFLDDSTASFTESTGLIQVAPVTPALLDSFDNVYSYRKSNKDSQNS